MKKTVLFSLFLLAAWICQAQSGDLKGTVKTSDGAPAEFVNIGLKGTTKGSVTNAKGEYEIKNIPSGTYTLVTSFVGLASKEINIEVKMGETIQVPEILLTEDAKTLKEVVVSGQTQRDASPYVAKVPLQNLENSQVYSVIDQKTMQTQQVFSMEKAMQNATGVSIVFPATGRAVDGGTYYTTRGFTTNASLINGIAGSVFSNPDASNIERIEVLKGPSATLYGSSLTSFGGAINVITKKPYDTLGGSIGVASGSWGLQRITADFNTPVNKSKTLLFRVNGVYHYQNSFQDYGFTKRMSVAPSISYKPSSRLSFQIDANLSQIQATLPPWYYADSATTGVTSAEKLKIDYRKYYFPGDLFATTKTTNVMAQMNYMLSDKWKSQTVFSSSLNQSEGPLTYLWFISDSSATRENQTYEGTTQQLNIQQNFLGDFKLLNMRHRFLGGADYYRNHSNSTYKFIPGMQDTILTMGPHPNYTDYNKSKFNNIVPMYFFGSYTGIQQTERVGAYVSDVINITGKLLLNAGVRFDHFVSQGYYDPDSDTTIGNYNQSALSPKFGLVYQLVKDKLSLFTNYQNSFQNVTGRDFFGNVFVPQRANQLEGGVKFSVLKNKVSGTVSVYDIVVNHTVRADIEHPTFSKQDGTQESKGIEAEVNVTAAKGLYVNLGYAYNDNKYITASDDVKGRRPVEAGPAHLAHAWVNYRLEEGALKGLGIGVGGNAANRKYTNNDTFAGVFYAPSYVVMNTAVFYDRPVFRVSLNVNNVTNKKYWVGWNQLAPQNPREFVVSAAWKF